MELVSLSVPGYMYTTIFILFLVAAFDAVIMTLAGPDVDNLKPFILMLDV